jgi:hypothetical protein
MLLGMNKKLIGGIILAVIIVGSYVVYKSLNPKYPSYTDFSKTEEEISKVQAGERRNDNLIKTDWKTFSNPKLGFEFKYPADYTAEYVPYTGNDAFGTSVSNILGEVRIYPTKVGFTNGTFSFLVGTPLSSAELEWNSRAVVDSVNSSNPAVKLVDFTGKLDETVFNSQAAWEIRRKFDNGEYDMNTEISHKIASFEFYCKTKDFDSPCERSPLENAILSTFKFTVPPQFLNTSITVLSPNGNQTLKIGQKYTIKWFDTDATSKVTIFAVKTGRSDGGSDISGRIAVGAGGIDNTRSFVWTVGQVHNKTEKIDGIDLIQNPVDAGKYKIEICKTDSMLVCDDSDQEFNISN